MAVVSTKSNQEKFQVMGGNIDYANDVFRIALMDDSFSFDEDAHSTFNDVIANEVAAGNGYSASGEILLSGELTKDDANDRGNMTWGDHTWTAVGGDIGPASAAIVYNDTSSEDTVIGEINFGQNITIFEGSSLKLQSIVSRIT